MLIAALVFAAFAAALHVFIFYLESVSWSSPRARHVFGTTEQQAEQTKEMAFNQRFYNLLLALQVFLGILLTAIGSTAVGHTLVLFGTGSMLAAATLLALTSPDKRSAALKQGLFPLLSVVFLLTYLAL